MPSPSASSSWLPGGMVVRDWLPSDVGAVLDIAHASFPEPAWVMGHTRNLVHYEASYEPDRALGRFRRRVIEAPDGNVYAYLFTQLRTNRDLYVRELAARPRGARFQCPLAGTSLLAAALADAMREETPPLRLTLNVLADGGKPYGYRDDRGRWRTPVGYYTRFGFAIAHDEPGYTLSGLARHPGDVWMVAEPRHALRRIRAYLRRSRVIYPVESHP